MRVLVHFSKFNFQFVRDNIDHFLYSSSVSSEKDPRIFARETALGRLGRRECSAKDIHQNLVRKGVSPEIATDVVAELIERELISDERFARMMTRHLCSRGKGPAMVRQKLREKGIVIALDKIQELMHELTNTTELDAAREIVGRRYPDFGVDRKEAQRAFQALVRRGFSFQVAREALKNPV